MNKRGWSTSNNFRALPWIILSCIVRKFCSLCQGLQSLQRRIFSNHLTKLVEIATTIYQLFSSLQRWSMSFVPNSSVLVFQTRCDASSCKKCSKAAKPNSVKFWLAPTYLTQFSEVAEAVVVYITNLVYHFILQQKFSFCRFWQIQRCSCIRYLWHFNLALFHIYGWESFRTSRVVEAFSCGDLVRILNIICVEQSQ